MTYQTLEDSIGNTPLIKLQRMSAEFMAPRGNVLLGKLEGNNPAGSVKDRPAISMIKRAEERGEIKPGHTLFHMDSEGQSFAYVADITNVPSLFARAPDWSVLFDMNPAMARMSRRRVFDMLVKDKMMAGGFHFPFPAFGTMEAGTYWRHR